MRWFFAATVSSEELGRGKPAPDVPSGCAVHTSLEAGVGYTTADLHVRYVRAMTESTGCVLAEGVIVHAGRRTATADGRLFVENDGTLLAHPTTGCAILR
jgi:uncharacterized protein (TIGR00369 family)